MSWSRFSYICRKLVLEDKEEGSLSQYVDRIDREKATDLYGPKIPTGSLQGYILDKLCANQSKEDGLVAADIYRKLNFNKKFEEPIQLKRVISYLSIVTAIFILVVLIYVTKVAPTFVEAYHDFNMDIPDRLLFYHRYWGIVFLLIAMSFFISISILLSIRKIFRFHLGVEKSLAFKRLLTRDIVNSYTRIVDIILFPLGANEKANTLVARHLNQVRDSGMDVGNEMRELIDREMQLLLYNCEKQMTLIATLMSLLFVVGVFVFLLSAYVPIFKLGELL